MRLSRQLLDDFNRALDDGYKIVGLQFVAVPEHFSHELPCVDTALKILLELFNVVENHKLVLAVVTHELQKENVALLDDT